jgi:hypothetical protein
MLDRCQLGVWRFLGVWRLPVLPRRLLLLQVKMRDVLTLVNGILCANSLSLGLGQGVPEVVQRHLADMEQQVKQQLGPPPAAAAAAPASGLEGQVREECERLRGPQGGGGVLLRVRCEGGGRWMRRFSHLYYRQLQAVMHDGVEWTVQLMPVLVSCLRWLKTAAFEMA